MQVVICGEEVRTVEFDAACEVCVVVCFPHAASNVNRIVKISIIDRKFVRINSDNGSFCGRKTLASSPMHVLFYESLQLTIFFMKAFDDFDVLPFAEVVVIEFIVTGRGGNLRAGELRERRENESICNKGEVICNEKYCWYCDVMLGNHPQDVRAPQSHGK